MHEKTFLLISPIDLKKQLRFIKGNRVIVLYRDMQLYYQNIFNQLHARDDEEQQVLSQKCPLQKLPSQS
jgi:hypothetical protein